jgi:hypothetical protein
MIQLNGVDFYKGHRHILFMSDSQYTYGPYPVKDLTSEIRPGQLFTLVQAPATKEACAITKREANLQTRDLRIMLDVFRNSPPHTEKIYQLWMPVLIQEWRITSHNELVVHFLPRAIYETYAQQLHDFLGKSMHHPY